MNRESARYCASCAAALFETIACPSCGAQEQQGRYCDQCGATISSLEGRSAEPPDHLAEKIRTGRSAIEGERKQVTVLFADVLGSMDLAEQIDAERWRAVMDRLFSILSAGVHRFEGTVDKFTGDGIMALFGAPIAHEDHARRACYAALELRRELRTFEHELRRTDGLSLAVRIGLNSGEVVVGTVGDDLAMEYTAVGHTVGLAQRMEQLAAPNSIYATDHTAAQAEGFVTLVDLGEFQVKGASRPLRVHEVAGVGPATVPLDVSKLRGFSRFVGRDEELRTLEHTLDEGFANHGQVIGIVGEAGVGKSRLCHEFAELARSRGLPVYSVAGLAHARSIPLVPVLQYLRTYFAIDENDNDEVARGRIAETLRLLDDRFEADLPLMYEFLGVPDRSLPAPRIDPDARQRRLLALMKRFTRARSARDPALVVFEDLHWLDPVSELFLANYIDAVQGSRGLTVLNFRPEYHAEWMSRSYYRQLSLGPLGDAEVGELLDTLLGDDTSLDGLADLVRRRTEGNPFFIEEVVASLAEAGALAGAQGAFVLAQPIDEAFMPVSVHAVLAARIDRLAPREKAVLQAASVIGREVPQAVLVRVVEIDSDELESVLHALVAKEFLYEHEPDPDAVYTFKHPLTQEVAYRSPLEERRAGVHAAVARAIEAEYPDRLDERAALLAQHWETGGEPLKAAHWHARAGAWAGTRDPAQAQPHWQRVRELAGELPKTPETIALMLHAAIALLNSGIRLGMSVEQANSVLDDGQQLATAAGDVRARSMLLSVYATSCGQWFGDVREYADLSLRALELAQESGDDALYVGVGATGAYALIQAGDYRQARTVSDRVIELSRGDLTMGAGITVDCPYAFALAMRGLITAETGDLAQGSAMIDDAIAAAFRGADVEVAGYAHMWSVRVAQLAGDADSALEHARATIAIAEEIGGALSLSWAWLWLGVAEGMRGAWAQSVDVLERSQAIAHEAGTATESEARRLALLAEAALGLGDAQRARILADEAVVTAVAQGHVVHEIHARLALARVLLDAGDAAAWPDVEAALARALELARTAGARGFEPLIRARWDALTHRRAEMRA